MRINFSISLSGDRFSHLYYRFIRLYSKSDLFKRVVFQYLFESLSINLIYKLSALSQKKELRYNYGKYGISKFFFNWFIRFVKIKRIILYWWPWSIIHLIQVVLSFELPLCICNKISAVARYQRILIINTLQSSTND